MSILLMIAGVDLVDLVDLVDRVDLVNLVDRVDEVDWAHGDGMAGTGSGSWQSGQAGCRAC